MKKAILFFSLLVAAATVTAQNVTRDASGNFHQVKKEAADSSRKTGNTYTTEKGEVFPVYVSKNGKFFIIRTSKNTGNQYKQYLKL